MRERPLSTVYDVATEYLRVTGAIDELNAGEFQTRVSEAAAAAEGQLVVDLSEVDYLPSTAVGILATFTRTSTVRLRTAQGSIAERVLQMCGLPHDTA